MFTHRVELRAGEAGAGREIPPGRLIDHLEEARHALFSVRGDPELAASWAVMARVEIDYIRPVDVSAEPLTVSLRVTHVGRSSFGLAAQFEQAGEVVSRATAVMVAYDAARRRSRPIGALERAALTRWRGGADG